jgi:hypothetical protein
MPEFEPTLVTRTGPTGPPSARGLAPRARFFSVPFLKGLAREVTSIHLDPSTIHLATIRDGSTLDVANRLTLARLPLGGVTAARVAAFRPLQPGRDTIELAVAGAVGHPGIARFNLSREAVLPGLPMEGVASLQYSPDGRFLGAGGRGGELNVWLMGPETPLRVHAANLGVQVESLAFHPEHPTLYAVLATGALVEVPLAPSPAAPVAEALRRAGAFFYRVAAGARGFALFLAGWDEQVYVADTATGEVGNFAPRVGPIQDLQVLPASGHLLVTGHHAVYLLGVDGTPAGTCEALLCDFPERIYAVQELAPDAILVFHAVG